MTIPIKIKRKDEGDGVDTAPGSLLQGELAFNEHSQVMHYGRGSSPAVVSIGGPGYLTKLPSGGTTLGFVNVETVRSGATMHTTSARVMTGTTNEVVITNGNGVGGNPTFGIADNAVMPGVEGIILPSGTTAQRVDTEGYLRYNTDDNIIEWRDNDSWEQPGASNPAAFAIVTADSGGPANADTSGDTIDLAGGDGIVTLAADGPESVTISLDIVGLTDLGAAPVGADSLALNDNGTGLREMTITNLFTSPALLTTPTAPTAAKATDTTQIATTAFVKSQDVNDLAAPGANFSMNSNKITGLSDGTADSDAVNFGQLTSVASGIDWKESVRCVSESNLDLTGEETIDGVTTSTDRVLVAGQTAPAENGIYVSAAGAWSRSGDADTSAEVNAGMAVFVEEGTTNADTGWLLTTNDPITLDTTGLAFSQFSGLGSIVAGTGLTKTGNTINAIGTASRISVAADSIDIDAAYVGQASITTLGTITTGTWNGTDIAEVDGGTGTGTYTTGDVLYSDAANSLAKLGIGSVGNMLHIVGGVPAWATNVDGGTF